MDSPLLSWHVLSVVLVDRFLWLPFVAYFCLFLCNCLLLLVFSIAKKRENGLCSTTGRVTCSSFFLFLLWSLLSFPQSFLSLSFCLFSFLFPISWISLVSRSLTGMCLLICTIYLCDFFSLFVMTIRRIHDWRSSFHVETGRTASPDSSWEHNSASICFKEYHNRVLYQVCRLLPHNRFPFLLFLDRDKLRRHRKVRGFTRFCSCPVLPVIFRAQWSKDFPEHEPNHGKTITVNRESS